MKGFIFSISRASAEDGPGIRTVVFLKGCHLHCVWCHSPQSQGDLTSYLSFYKARCIGCGACVRACPNEAQTIFRGKKVVHRKLCKLCGRCVEACPTRAMEFTGHWQSVSEVMAVIRRDAAFYKSSGGGVTFSGGEPLMQPEFLLSALKQCRLEGFHTAIETSGFAHWPVIEQILPYTNLFLYDIKHMNPERHRKLTGVDNKLILENLRRIGESATSIWIRLPLIPGMNDDEDNLSAVASFVREISEIKNISLLPYNVSAGARYLEIGKSFTLKDLKTQSREKLNNITRTFNFAGITTEVGRQNFR